MKKYVNISASGAIESAEFTPMAGGNMAFFQLRDDASAKTVKEKLAAVGVEQEVVAESKVDGKPLLVTRGNHTQAELLALLEKSGEALAPAKEKKKFDPWVIRSLLGFGGQGLQLWSAFLRPMRPDRIGKGAFAHVDTSVFVFAATNLTANAINLIYRGQDVPDPHRTNYVKQQVNNKLAPQLKEGETAIDTRDDRMWLRDPEYHQRHALTGFHGFMQRHSVNVGELGLRYLGAFGLAYPVRHWSAQARADGRFMKMNDSNLRVFTGMASMTGKTVALTSKVPDPFNPKPTTWLDTLREKFTFMSGGWIETGAFAALAYDNFFNTSPGDRRNNNHNRSIVFRGVPQRDWIGGVGASMFVAGYIVRHWAKYGSRHVDMAEIYAHTGDTLAKLPPEKVPQALADISSHLADHFKDDPKLSYGVIYNHLAADLCRYHQPTAQQAHVAEPVMTDEPATTPGTKVAATGALHTSPASAHRQAAHST